MSHCFCDFYNLWLLVPSNVIYRTGFDKHPTGATQIYKHNRPEVYSESVDITLLNKMMLYDEKHYKLGKTYNKVMHFS
jgi:hypothetical protein